MSDEPRYILSKKIARGGMAEIFLGKQIGEDGFQRLCAIKRILPHYTNDQEFIQMFRDEAHICKRLQHANIVRVEGFEEVEGSYAIIMEYVDGADLRTLLHAVEQAKRRLPVPMACYIIAESARGLHYAHTKIDEITQQALGIVHRDISPQNLLVSFEGEIKVTDFGIADAESKLTETRPGIVKGKYSYMSPEQISAKPVDCRTDVFAMTIVLWEMLAMRRLFQGENEVDTIQRVKNCRIDVDIRTINPEVDEELDLILKKGLARDPKKRYRTAADFEKDLRRYMSRRHPEFTPDDLGKFLKETMESRRSESAAEIKRTLTETNLRPGRKSKSALLPTPAAAEPAPSAPLTLATNGMSHTGAQRPFNNTGLSMPAARPLLLNNPGQIHRSAAAQRLRPGGRPATSLGKTLVMTIIVAAVALYAGKSALKLTAQSGKPATFTLRTQPSRVRVMIDSKPVNRGRYVQASTKNPLRLTLPPGDHVLLVTRPGYQPIRYQFSLEEGEKETKDDIVLKEKTPLAALKVRLRTGERGAKINIDHGFWSGKLHSGQTVAVTPDVLPNKAYKIHITPDDDREFICNFTAKSTSWRSPTELIIDIKARKCTVTGS